MDSLGPKVQTNIIQNKQDNQENVQTDAHKKKLLDDAGFKPLNQRKGGPLKLTGFYITNLLTLGGLGVVGKSLSHTPQIMGSSKNASWTTKIKKDIGQTYLNATAAKNADPKKDNIGLKVLQKGTKAMTYFGGALSLGYGIYKNQKAVNENKAHQINQLNKLVAQDLNINPEKSKGFIEDVEVGFKSLINKSEPKTANVFLLSAHWINDLSNEDQKNENLIDKFYSGKAPEYFKKAFNIALQKSYTSENGKVVNFFKSIAEKNTNADINSIREIRSSLRNSSNISKFDMMDFRENMIISQGKSYDFSDMFGQKNQDTVNFSTDVFNEVTNIFDNGNKQKADDQDASIADKFADFKARYDDARRRFKNAEKELISKGSDKTLEYQQKALDIKNIQSEIDELKKETYQGNDAEKIGKTLSHAVKDVKKSLESAANYFGDQCNKQLKS